MEEEEANYRDRYNTLEGNKPQYEFARIVNAKIELAPTSKESLQQYIFRIKIYQKIQSDKEWSTHVDNPYKTWHCHKNPMGCFICDGTKFISVLVQVLDYIEKAYPDTVSFNKTESD